MIIFIATYLKTQITLMGFAVMSFSMAMRNFDGQFAEEGLDPVPPQQQQVLPPDEEE